MSWFSNVLRHFSRMTHDVGAGAIAVSFGLPFELGPAATRLLLHAHTGDPTARAKVHHLSARGPEWHGLLLAISQALRAHPHFATFEAHAHHPHDVAPPPALGIPSAPLSPHAHAHLARHPHTPHGPIGAGLISHPSWGSGHEWAEDGAHQEVEAGYASHPTWAAGDWAEQYETGHQGHHHHGPHREPGRGGAFGLFEPLTEALLVERDSLEEIPAFNVDDPEAWQTPQHPRGTPGV